MTASMRATTSATMERDMELTDSELDSVQSVLYEEVYYGDDDVVYGDGPYVVALRSALAKVEDEIKRRGIR